MDRRSDADAASVDDRCVDALYRRYGPMIYRRCWKLLRDKEAARDATQEVFIKLLRNQEKLEDAENALPWIYRVATYHCLNELRGAARSRDREMPMQDEDTYGDLGSNRCPDRDLVRSILSRFGTRTQAVAVGVLVDEMEHEEVAAALQISRRTVARELKRFVQNARKFMVRSGTWDVTEDAARVVG
jgi:RNA polymerase sigma-70 factor, ECF subfamily